MLERIEMLDALGNTVLYDGAADVEPAGKNGLCIKFHDGQKAHIYHIYEKGCILSTQSDASIRLVLRPDAASHGKVETEYGMVEIPCQVLKYQMLPDGMEVLYVLEEDENAQQFHFRLKRKPSETGGDHGTN